MLKSLENAKSLQFVDAELRPILDIFSGFDVNRETLPALRNLPTSKPLKTPPFQEYFVKREQGDGRLRLLVVTPENEGVKSKGLLYMHGGGFVFGSPETILPSVQKLAHDTGRIIVLPQYRLAPEFPYPAALEDNLLALKWMYQQADILHLDRNDIAIGGDSAGGGHGAVLAAAVRGREDVSVSRLFMIYPMLDDRTGVQGTAENNTGEFIWTKENNRFGWASYLGGETKLNNGSIPARLNDLEGFPPTFIATGSLDLFMEENIRFIERLQETGIVADIYMAEGAFHAFNVMVPEAQVSKAFHAACVRALNKPF